MNGGAWSLPSELLKDSANPDDEPHHIIGSLVQVVMNQAGINPPQSSSSLSDPESLSMMPCFSNEESHLKYTALMTMLWLLQREKSLCISGRIAGEECDI